MCRIACLCVLRFRAVSVKVGPAGWVAGC
jgi:hypothetical protein